MLLMVLISLTMLILVGIVTGFIDDNREEKLIEDYCSIECR